MSLRQHRQVTCAIAAVSRVRVCAGVCAEFTPDSEVYNDNMKKEYWSQRRAQTVTCSRSQLGHSQQSICQEEPDQALR